ncbi:unnamed protein product [Candidula unifasciata]|uniref:Methyltransferase type 11 domain-containing protein n=1 Tax=Candidula unifasciata TaxID=100452 RepID=A0A8S3Z6W1_9EUPU|nr:unnamed protein product [Candidula unifasciata]
MSEFDARLSTALYHIAILGTVAYFVAVYVFGFRKEKLEAFICYLLSGWVHRKFFHREKAILFQQMQDIKQKSKTELAILEIGVGSGMNFRFYPEGTRVTCLDPNPHHEAYLRKNLQKCDKNVKVVGFIQSFAENISAVESDTFDAVVCTLTLCTVRDPAKVLSEVRRVLKPGGTFFFLEHVAAQKGSFIRRVQNILQYMWPHLASGCNINRETWSFLDQSEFSQVQYRHYSANTWLFFYLRPSMYGTAVK